MSSNDASAQCRSSTTTTAGRSRTKAPRKRDQARPTASVTDSGAIPSSGLSAKRDPGRARERRHRLLGVLGILDQAPDEPAELRLGRRRGVVEQDAGGAPDDLPQGPVGDALAIGQAAAAMDSGAWPDAGDHLVGQACLADTRLADDGDQPRSRPSTTVRLQPLDQGQLVGAPDERRLREIRGRPLSRPQRPPHATLRVAFEPTWRELLVRDRRRVERAVASSTRAVPARAARWSPNASVTTSPCESPSP